MQEIFNHAEQTAKEGKDMSAHQLTTTDGKDYQISKIQRISDNI